LAAATDRPLLSVDLGALANAGRPLLPALQLALRDGLLLGALTYLRGWDVILKDAALQEASSVTLFNHPGPIIVAGQQPWRVEGMNRQQRLCSLNFDLPAYDQRLSLWHHFLNGAADGFDNAPDSLSDLAGQFQLTAGQIRDAVATGQDRAAQAQTSLQTHHLFSAARTHSNPNLAALARKIKPRYGWEDIVLPEDQLAQLREIVTTVRGRPQVLDAWGLGQKLVSSRGVTALFAGPPGTGKTMAAEIIANELGLDLYKIDLSTVVSKYIGETEKNLERIFAEAESSNAILFFDEADALFGKRSEVRDSHDRYANIEISYLLQRMEVYDGVTILATNLRANLDEAFTRRLGFAVDFPFPEAAERQRIWQTLLPAGVPHENKLDFAPLAENYRLAGGNIRNILVSAAYLATADGGCVTMDHLRQGARRELQKMGQLVLGEEFTN
jgi:ATP-dependent 26S proteasome regulatory subunit